MKKIILILLVIVVVVGGGFTLNYLNNYEVTLYTKIDNSKIHSVENQRHPDGLNYEYNLPCYDQDGHEKTCQFKTNRELRADAYLALNIRAFGVHGWVEVSHEELPAKVQSKI